MSSQSGRQMSNQLGTENCYHLIVHHPITDNSGSDLRTMKMNSEPNMPWSMDSGENTVTTFPVRRTTFPMAPSVLDPVPMGLRSMMGLTLPMVSTASAPTCSAAWMVHLAATMSPRRVRPEEMLGETSHTLTL